MLNAKKERELAYIVTIDAIEPIIGSDNCEAAVVGGWRVMTRKGTFTPGAPAIYFEIDSKVDETKPEFAFMERYHGKVKTQKYTFGGKGLMISQGLLMHPSDFGWKSEWQGKQEYWAVRDNEGNIHSPLDESRFLTKLLSVTYSVVEDNARKANSADKYKKMAQRRPEIFRQGWAKWMMRREWGKKVMFFFFGKKKDVKKAWPSWVVKTDEERVQNMPWILADKSEWFATEKIDGTSTTFTMRRVGRKKFEFFVCSRNVVFDKPDKACFYDTNVYTEMAEKYHVKDVLRGFLEQHPETEWVTLQGETYGEGIQRRDYGLKGHDFMGFNFITSDLGRWGSDTAAALMAEHGIPWVPIVDKAFVMPDTVEELLAIATDSSNIDGGMREGLVFRSPDGTKSFKAVSNEFLLRFHS